MDGLTSFRQLFQKHPEVKGIADACTQKLLTMKLLSTQKLVFIKKGACCAKRICLLPCVHYTMHMQGSYESAELRVMYSSKTSKRELGCLISGFKLV